MKMKAQVLCMTLGFVCLPGLAAEDVPRTPGGRPDLSGNYDVSVLTPLERDPKHGNNLYMSTDEATAIETASSCQAWYVRFSSRSSRCQ